MPGKSGHSGGGGEPRLQAPVLASLRADGRERERRKRKGSRTRACGGCGGLFISIIQSGGGNQFLQDPESFESILKGPQSNFKRVLSNYIGLNRLLFR